MTAPTKLDGGGSGCLTTSGRSRPGDAGTSTHGAAVPAAVDHLPMTRAWLLRQLQLECSACDGLGYLPCPCDSTIDCTCPLWECPECEGTGGPDFDQGEGVLP